MPISFGVLLSALGLTVLVSSSVSWGMYRDAARADEASRASERRLTQELTQLRAVASALQAQLDQRAQDIATQTREIERISADLDSLRSRGGFDARPRARRTERAGR